MFWLWKQCCLKNVPKQQQKEGIYKCVEWIDKSTNVWLQCQWSLTQLRTGDFLLTVCVLRLVFSWPAMGNHINVGRFMMFKATSFRLCMITTSHFVYACLLVLVTLIDCKVTLVQNSGNWKQCFKYKFFGVPNSDFLFI